MICGPCHRRKMLRGKHRDHPCEGWVYSPGVCAQCSCGCNYRSSAWLEAASKAMEKAFGVDPESVG